MSMALADDDLLPGELRIRSRFANLLVDIKDERLSRFACRAARGALLHGEDVDAVGGRLHLTSYRLIFKAHAFNRVRGMHSIFLPNITGLSADFWTLRVTTGRQTLRFVMWVKRPFTAQAREARAALDEAARGRLRQAILEMINRLCLAGFSEREAVEALGGGTAGLLEVDDLFRQEGP